MNCKNCKTSLDERVNFCPLCGAKIIRNRLTLKNIWADINAQFISIDNKLFKTFIHLFTKPELVINGFIDGTRKKYIGVIQYFAISLTLVGIQVFLMNTFFSDDLEGTFDFLKSLENTNKTENNPFTGPSPFESFNDINRYQSLIYTLMVPMYTLGTWLAYMIVKTKKRYNFTEHLVLNLYYNAQIIIITAFLSILFLCFGFDYLLISGFVTLVLFLYFFYLLKRVFNTSFWETVAHFMLIMVIFMVVYLIIGIIAIIGGIVYAILTNQPLTTTV